MSRPCYPRVAAAVARQHRRRRPFRRGLHLRAVTRDANTNENDRVEDARVEASDNADLVP